jgi:hypothetical protein
MYTDEGQISFYLAGRYFRDGSRSNCCPRNVMQSILRDAFGMELGESLMMMLDNPDGFEIVCRKDQFAVFIVLRHERFKGVNGIKDLRPKLIKARSPVNTINVSDNNGC